jgi:hypothetical protein
MEGVMHLTPEDDALVQGLLDGSLDRPEREAAERLVKENGDAQRRSAELSELARLLDGLGGAEPPVDFSAQVMRAVGAVHVHAEINLTLETSGPRLSFGERLSQLMDGGFGMGKKVMWGLAAAGALALVVMKIIGYPPIDGAQGTIGAAKRYQADQIAPADVKVDDSAQAFVQSDVFDQMLKDNDTRQLLANGSFRAALAAPEFRAALASPELVRALASAEFRATLARPEMVRALASPEMVRALANPEMVRALANPEMVRALAAAPGFAQALANPGFVHALANPGFVHALASPGFVHALASPGFVHALASPGFVHALASPGFANALASAQMAQALAAVSQ